MISIIIPVFNYDCTALITELARQAAELEEQETDCRVEIIVMDDNSTDLALKEHNRRVISALPRCRFIALARNVGRAACRNHLRTAAQYDYLLLIDSDAACHSPRFLSTYWQARHTADVLCGDLRNPTTCAPGHELRYRYERNAEPRRTLAQRRAHPFRSLCTFNIFGRRAVFEAVPFDPRCTDYGYEDALFGLELQQRGFTIGHIDNPLTHTGIDTNAEFLHKTETALRTLSHLDGLMQENAGASRTVRLLSRIGLQGAAAALFRALRRPLRANLLSRHPSLLLFKCYKLGYYADITHPAARHSR